MVVIAVALVMVAGVVWMVSVETDVVTRMVWMVVMVSVETDVAVAMRVFVGLVGGTIGSEVVILAVAGDVGRADMAGGVELAELSVCSMNVTPGAFWE